MTNDKFIQSIMKTIYKHYSFEPIDSRLIKSIIDFIVNLGKEYNIMFALLPSAIIENTDFYINIDFPNESYRITLS